MKILSEEELRAHREVITYGGIKGALLGGAITAMIFTVGKRRYPAIGRLPIAFKTALFIAPPTFGASCVAELAALDFEKSMHHQDPRVAERKLQELRRWHSLSFKEKTIETLSSNKYKIIVGAWAASLWGSWALVDRDPIMTQAQKIVQARVYAQFLTVGLLLGTIGLSVYEEKLEKLSKHKKIVHTADDAWKDIIEDEEK